MSFFTELRRRNIFKVGAAYAIVAWLLIQIADVVLPALQAPEWTVGFVTVLFILGFPIALLLAWAYEMTPAGIKSATAVQQAESITHATGQRLNYLILGLVVLAVGFLVSDQYVFDQGIRANVVGPTVSSAESLAPSTDQSATAQVLRFSINLGPVQSVGGTELSAHIAISPDGRQLVYAAGEGARMRLYLRALDRFETRAMPGTEGAFHPFFSPDGEWVGFYTEAASPALKKISIRGGAPQNLADTNFSTGGSWELDDTIIYGTGNPTEGRSLYLISANGGTSEPLISADFEKGYVTPEVLPGGEAVLFVIRPGQGGVGNAADGSIAVLSRETGEVRTLIEGGYRPKYAPTGHILFVRAGDLWAVPFDLERLEKSGAEVPVIQGVQQGGFQGAAAYAFSDNGLLAYVPGGFATNASFTTPVWVDRQGREEPLGAEPNRYGNPRLSPDGQQLAVAITEPGNSDIWIYDLARKTWSRLTFSPDAEGAPIWTPDGERVVFASTRDGGGLYWKAANGAGQVSRISERVSAPLWPDSIAPLDGAQLVYQQDTDIYVVSLLDEPVSQPLLDSASQSAISPDGRWISYASDETGAFEVYVRPYPNVNDGIWQISSDGGTEPLWGPDSNELFYRGDDGVMAVSVETEPTLSSSNPTLLFQSFYAGAANLISPTYDISHDGQRFLMMKYVGPTQEDSEDVQLHVVSNWFAELNRLAPPSE